MTHIQPECSLPAQIKFTFQSLFQSLITLQTKPFPFHNKFHGVLDKNSLGAQQT